MTFTAADGTTLSYLATGEGEPLVVVPGGPGRDAAYLGDLGGLAQALGRRVVVLEPRGTGGSARPERHDAITAEHIAEDLETLRVELGVDRMDLVTHSAGAAVAYLYADTHPERLNRLVLLNPSGTMVGLKPSPAENARQVALRENASWFAQARGALDLAASIGWSPEIRQATAPFLYARWGRQEREHAAAADTQIDQTVQSAFWTGPTDRVALRERLEAVDVPVHVVVGERDLAPGPVMGERIARLFPYAEVHVLKDAAHFPWLDDSTSFRALMARALADPLVSND
ncbi:MAG: alpha/beta hydrolase [Mobilicoccus sp.]|nr:alpha/beta hydrolase [Mobilicoccus sp.]